MPSSMGSWILYEHFNFNPESLNSLNIFHPWGSGLRLLQNDKSFIWHFRGELAMELSSFLIVGRISSLSITQINKSIWAHANIGMLTLFRKADLVEEAAGWPSKCVICYLTSLWPGFKFAVAQNATSVLSEHC